jgi:hypothetical protein
MTPEQIDVLVARATAGTLTPAEAQTLLNACRADPSITAALQRDMKLERLLAFNGSQHSEPGAFTKEVMALLNARAGASAEFVGQVMRQLPERRRVLRFPVYLAWAAAAMICVGMGWFLTSRSAPVARLTGVEAVQWVEPPKKWSVGGRVHVAAGFAQIRFARGAELILEGGAEIELTGDNSAILHRGAAAVEVPPSAAGFTLVGPDARIVDVGTRFAMSAMPREPTQIHVLEGLVLVSTSAQPDPRELRRDQAIEIVSGKMQPIRINPTRFMTALPSRHDGEAGYLHWGFNESGGIVCRNNGPGIDGNIADAFFRAAFPDGLLPERSAGVFGNGIFLDGKSAYLETDFPGIGGAHARTVAMWVKVPSDWTAEHGYALASWGSLNKFGQAWQMSVNPADFGGPLGHLRVGTHGNYAVGVTDIRDGKWHHVAAVMFEGALHEDGTQVLLYVDGRLEPAKVKYMRSIDTAIGSPGAVKFQIGRNLSVTRVPNQPRRFFRGWIDELFVADKALTARQIQMLMSENRFISGSRSEEVARSLR